tara:strand:- start:1319 stop:1744 length:426 start_codon:yes stop_codon:yes gene_type:complete
MIRLRFFFLAVFLLLSLIKPQEITDFEKFGFIDIKTDSMNVPFFIDGVFVGKHPLPEPIAVLPGFHEVGYIPPEIQNRKIRDDLSDGLKRVYVAPNDTLKVFLFYDYYLAQVKSLENEFKIQNYIGVGLFGILLYLLFSII